jgi:transcriptional regulator with XRE-family HTH domain
MYNLSIGWNIKRWRSFRGKKQQVFANEIGVSRNMLSRYENGKSTVSVQQLQKIASCLQVSLDNLLTENAN